MSGVKARFATVVFPPPAWGLQRYEAARRCPAQAAPRRWPQTRLAIKRPGKTPQLCVRWSFTACEPSHGTEERRRVAATLTAAALTRVAISPIPTPGTARSAPRHPTTAWGALAPSDRGLWRPSRPSALLSSAVTELWLPFNPPRRTGLTVWTLSLAGS